MRKQGGFIHFILFFAVIVIVLLAILFLSVFKTKNKIVVEPTLSANPDTIVNISDSWDIPSLPEGFDWQTKTLDKNESIDYRMFWSATDNSNTNGYIPFSSVLHFVDLNYDDTNDILDYHDFVNNIDKALNDKGWSFDVNYGTKKIMGTAADGVFGSLYGNVKVKENIIRSVGYSYNLTTSSWDGPGSEVVCPCQLHMEVFVGDEVDLKNFQF